jgi:hypothetical protein
MRNRDGINSDHPGSATLLVVVTTLFGICVHLFTVKEFNPPIGVDAKLALILKSFQSHCVLKLLFPVGRSVGQ